MSYSYKDVTGRQRVIPVINIFLYPRGEVPTISYLGGRPTTLHYFHIGPSHIRLHEIGQSYIESLLYGNESLALLCEE